MHKVMAPKVPEKQHNQQQHHQQPVHNNSIAIKHSNTFHISAFTLCHNKRLKVKRSKYGEYLRNAYQNKRSAKQKKFKKTDDVRRQRLSLLQADVTIDLLSDNEDQNNGELNTEKSSVIYPERMCLERAAILGLMPVERLVKPLNIKQVTTNLQQKEGSSLKQTQNVKTSQIHKQQSTLLVPAPKQLQRQQPRKRKSKPQKRSSLPTPLKTPYLVNTESIVLSDDSNDVPMSMPPPLLPQTYTPLLQPSELSVTCPTSCQIPCLPQQNTIQVDEEVTISLVPRSLNATSCASRTSLNSSNCAETQQDAFPMLPDETTVHTVIANRIYELSLAKLREGLASCGIPEFAEGQQKVSPQRRKGMVQQPPLVSPPQAPISLKLSSDLSISLISDDEEDIRQNNCRDEPILSPAFLQKLPVNVSIAPVPLVPTNSTHATEPRKLKLG